VKWIFEDGMVYPACPRCGAYPMGFFRRDEYGHYVLLCPNCERVVAVTKYPHKFAMRAFERRRRQK